MLAVWRDDFRWYAQSLATAHICAVRELRKQGAWNHWSQQVRSCETLEQGHRGTSQASPVADLCAVIELMGLDVDASKPAPTLALRSTAQGSKTAQEAGRVTPRTSLMLRTEARAAAQQARSSITHWTDPTSSLPWVVACQGVRQGKASGTAETHRQQTCVLQECLAVPRAEDTNEDCRLH